MLTYESLFTKLSQLCTEQNCQLYDVSMPGVNSKTLQLFVTDNDGSSNIEQCVKIAKIIRKSSEYEFFTSRYSIEVSSPGVNRRLKRDEHFMDSIGEHIKFTVNVDGIKETLKGTLTEFENRNLKVELDGKKEIRSFNLDNVIKVNIDYIF